MNQQRPPSNGGAGPAAYWDAQRSRVVREMLRTAAQFALSDLAIRISGEKGTGKQLLARWIHLESPRSSGPFERLDCSEIPGDEVAGRLFGSEGSGDASDAVRPGILETAAGGTAYIDACEELDPAVRERLLRTVVSRHFRRAGGTDDLNLGARVILGTAPGPFPGQVSGGREGAWRPGPVSINVPPLRERREDIESLIYLFLGEFSGGNGKSVTQITADALEFCRYYEWPGNIYELRNVIRHSAARSARGEIGADDLPEYLRSETTRSGKTAARGVTALRG